MAIWAVFGTGGFGREVMPLVRLMAAKTAGVEVVFVVDGERRESLNGQRVVTFDELTATDGERLVTIAVADGGIRKELATRCADAGLTFLDVSAPSVIRYDNCRVGPGAILCDNVTLTSDLIVGAHFHANIYSYVAHDCVIGDFVTFAPAVKANGNVRIEDDVYIGTGAIIRPGLPGKPLVIGRGAIIGMGAVVTKSVPPGVTVVGNPARALEPRSTGS